MTSFVSTATTMFNRFPLRYTRQKEPQIGSPVLVDSSRPDVLLLSGDNEKLMLPAFPGSHNTTRYTTTPDFESSPIIPSSAVPPAFYQIPQLTPKSPPSSKKNVFNKKSNPPQHPKTRPQKSIDLIEAASQTVSATSSFSSRKTSEDNSSSSNYISSPNPLKKSISIPSLTTDTAKAPRLRDSIVPAMKPLDNSFFGDLYKELKTTEQCYTSTQTIKRKTIKNAEPTISQASVTESTPSKPQSLLDRKHPLAAIGEKIVESQTTMLNNPDKFQAPAPVLNSADEHILQLEAQRDELVAEQRYLVARIRNVEEVLPPNPATHDLKQRALLREELRELQSQYDGIGKKLHETGMMLHRAWRRRDTKLGIEAPAVLWVRKISS